MRWTRSRRRRDQREPRKWDAHDLAGADVDLARSVLAGARDEIDLSRAAVDRYQRAQRRLPDEHVVDEDLCALLGGVDLQPGDPVFEVGDVAGQLVPALGRDLVDTVPEVLAKVAEGGGVIVTLVGDLAEVVENLVVWDQVVGARELGLGGGEVAILIELDAAMKTALRFGQLGVVAITRQRRGGRLHGRFLQCVRGARTGGNRGQRDGQDRVDAHLKGSDSSIVRSEAGRLVSRIASSNGGGWPRVSATRCARSSASSRRAGCAR